MSERVCCAKRVQLPSPNSSLFFFVFFFLSAVYSFSFWPFEHCVVPLPSTFVDPHLSFIYLFSVSDRFLWLGRAILFHGY